MQLLCVVMGLLILGLSLPPVGSCQDVPLFGVVEMIVEQHDRCNAPYSFSRLFFFFNSYWTCTVYNSLGSAGSPLFLR